VLSNRKKEVLYYIIQSYVENMQPVSSKALTANFKESISAATIRNEMSELEEMGFITHPHTSAGRIPTDKGYRYYVDYLLQQDIIQPHTAEYIENEITDKIESLEDLIIKTARIVSTVSHEACVAAVFSPTFLMFKQVNLVALDHKRILVIWITTAGTVHNSTVVMDEGVSGAKLKQIENMLNSELGGLPLDEIERVILDKLSQERTALYEVYHWARYIVQTTLTQSSYDFKMSLGGRHYLLEKPEFKDVRKTKRIFTLLENSRELRSLIDDDCENALVSVRIGQENSFDEMWDCSLIKATYKVRNIKAGTITIVGSRRIHYEKVIPLVDYISSILAVRLNKIEV
jgi:heat-inducible transcriptional repressor